MELNEQLGKAEAYQNKIAAIVEKQIGLLEEKSKLDKDKDEYTRRKAREEHKIKNEILNAVDENGKSLYSNEAKRNSAFIEASEKNDSYQTYEKRLLQIFEKERELILAMEIEGKKKNAVISQMRLQGAILEGLSALQ